MFKIDGDTIIISKYVKELDVDILNAINENKIKHIKFEEGSELVEIKQNAFAKNAQIESLDFTNCKKLKRVGKEAFLTCKNLKNVDFSGCESLEILGESLFEQNINLEYIDFENCTNLRQIEQTAFRYSKNLKQVNFNGCGKIEKIPVACFEECPSLESIDLSDAKNITAIESFAFGHCTGLKEVKFYDNAKDLKLIDSRAFTNCENLKKLDFSNSGLEHINRNAFAYCFKLRELDLSNCVNLQGLSSIKVGLVRSDEPLFDSIDLRGCTNLKRVYNFTTKDIKFSFIPKYDQGLRGILSSILNKDANISFYDRNGNLSLQFKNDSKLSRLNLYSAGLFHYWYLKKKGTSSKMNISALNVLTSTKELDEMLKYYNELELFISNAVEKLGNKRFCTYGYGMILRQLGVCGIDADKSELETYKNLLAKNLIWHKIKNDIRSDVNRDYINKLIQQKTNKIAKSYSLSKLVLEFVKNNIAGKDNEEMLLLEFADFAKLTPKINVKFNEFFVSNIDDIMQNCVYRRVNNTEFQQINDYLPITKILNEFDDIIKKSNKKVVSRQNNQRFTVEDCKSIELYQNIISGNEELAKLCGSAKLSQKDFEKLQDIFEKGKAVKESQVLTICKDESNSDFTYNFIEKDNPIGLVLGNITNCCQRLGSVSRPCMIDGATNKNSGFVTINYKGDIIGQAWVWYDPRKKTIALDNIEVPDVFYKLVNKENPEPVCDCIKRICTNFFNTMNYTGKMVDNIYIGVANTDIELLKEKYETNFQNLKCPYCSYTDVNSKGKYLVYLDGKECAKGKSNEITTALE